jgi:hypothetical protein
MDPFWNHVETPVDARGQGGMRHSWPMNARTFRRIALGLGNCVEGAHMGHPDFRAANGRVFASLVENEKRGTAKLAPDQQHRFVAEAPKAFQPAAGAWGRQGWTTIVLADADEESVGEALTLAWQGVAALAATTPKRRPAPKTAARRIRAAKKR